MSGSTSMLLIAFVAALLAELVVVHCTVSV